MRTGSDESSHPILCPDRLTSRDVSSSSGSISRWRPLCLPLTHLSQSRCYSAASLALDRWNTADGTRSTAAESVLGTENENLEWSERANVLVKNRCVCLFIE